MIVLQIRMKKRFKTEPLPDGSGFKRKWFVAAGILWLFDQILCHVIDYRFYIIDSGRMLIKSLDLIDLGEFPLAGDTIFQNFHLGPLAELLGSIPLLFSRDIYFQYYFISLLGALALVVFYLACKDLFPGSAFKWIGLLAFGIATLDNYSTDILITNTQFLPLFQALYFYCLVRCLRWRAGAILSVWLMVGLCMQIHFSCSFLIPTTLVATRPYKNFRQIILTLAGLGLVVATHSTVLYQYFVHYHRSQTEPQVQQVLTWATGDGIRLFFNYCIVLWRMLISMIYDCSIGNALYVFLALFSFKKLLTLDTKVRPLIQAALFHIIFSALISPLLNLIKDPDLQYGFQKEYFHSGLVFWIFLAGLFVFLQFSGRPQEKTTAKNRFFHLHLFVLLAVLTELIIAASLFIFSFSPCKRELSLNDQVHIGERLYALITEKDLQDIQILEREYIENEAIFSSQNFFPETYTALCTYLHPDLRQRLSASPSRYLVVWTTKDGPAHEPPLGDSLTILDRFNIGCWRVKITLGDLSARDFLLRNPG